MQDLQGTIHPVQLSSALFPLLRSQLVGELLTWLYLRTDESFSVVELSRHFGTSQPTMSREADRLVSAGLVLEQRRGNMRLLRANLDTPLARPLTELLVLTYGPAVVLGELLATVDGVREALIYGSWAARYSGEAGPVPRDVDVLVVGSADEDVLFDAARAAERRLGREVNVRQVSVATWESTDDNPFLASVRGRPTVQLELRRESS
ncbi:ArsR family transcriptional regulator [Luedemannella flava]|uniref:ArsR family transcriptional regulator n=1 Tax=Luedemannella flava TaxID=349316 RepID=A0ABP4Z3N9_9ACTN